MGGFESGEEQSVIRLLPYDLRLAKFVKQDMYVNLKELMCLLFYCEGKSTFFSYTEIDDEISLFVDKQSLTLFPRDSYYISNQKWRAIEIYEGSDAINQVGHIKKYSEPLSRNKMNIIYLSTYDTDLILVEENDCEKAMKCLREVVNAEEMRNNGVIHIVKPQQERKLPQFLSSNKAISELEHSVEDSVGLTPLTYALAIIGCSYTVFRSYMHTFLKLFIHHDIIDQRFLSITFYQFQFSIVLNREFLSSLIESIPEDNIKANDFSWNPIHVQEIPEGVSSDVVSFASDILAENGVSIYYLSTMTDDYILVPTDLLENAVNSLETFSTSPQTSSYQSSNLSVSEEE